MHAEKTIKVRYTGGTYLARVPGLKVSASCTISPLEAARAMARKLGADPATVTHQNQPAQGSDLFTFQHLNSNEGNAHE